MTPKPQAIFFDMDGTLLDWQVGMNESWAVACEAGCASLPGIDPADLLAAVKLKRDWFWANPIFQHEGRMDLDRASRIIVTEAISALGADAPDVAATIAADYRARRLGEMVLYPGAIDLLDRLKSAGTPMALITNGAAGSQRHSVERFGLAPYFDCIVIEGEFGCGKPDERVFHHALQTIGCDPAATWMAGDNVEADIETPHRLGMHTVWVDGEGVGLPADVQTQPHRTITTIAELMWLSDCPS